MSKLEPNEELLSAYLDGELADGVRLEVEKRLQTDAEFQQCLDDFHALRESIQQLPQHKLGPDFSQRVLERIREKTERSNQVAPREATPAKKATASSESSGNKRGWLPWVIGALAASVLLGLALPMFKGAPNVALQTEDRSGAVADSVDQLPEQLLLKDSAGNRDAAVVGRGAGLRESKASQVDKPLEGSVRAPGIAQRRQAGGFAITSDAINDLGGGAGSLGTDSLGTALFAAADIRIDLSGINEQELVEVLQRSDPSAKDNRYRTVTRQRTEAYTVMVPETRTRNVVVNDGSETKIREEAYTVRVPESRSRNVNYTVQVPVTEPKISANSTKKIAGQPNEPAAEAIAQNVSYSTTEDGNRYAIVETTMAEAVAFLNELDTVAQAESEKDVRNVLVSERAMQGLAASQSQRRNQSVQGIGKSLVPYAAEVASDVAASAPAPSAPAPSAPTPSAAASSDAIPSDAASDEAVPDSEDDDIADESKNFFAEKADARRDEGIEFDGELLDESAAKNDAAKTEDAEIDEKAIHQRSAEPSSIVSDAEFVDGLRLKAKRELADQAKDFDHFESGDDVAPTRGRHDTTDESAANSQIQQRFLRSKIQSALAAAGLGGKSIAMDRVRIVLVLDEANGAAGKLDAASPILDEPPVAAPTAPAK